MKGLWNINLKNIPLGWNTIYQEALAMFPNGQINKSYFYDPVGYRDKLLKVFEEEKKKALELIEDQSVPFSEKANLLLKIDVKLFNIIYEWVDSKKFADISVFNPKNLLLNDIENYFTSEVDNEYNPRLFEFTVLKFIKYHV